MKNLNDYFKIRNDFFTEFLLGAGIVIYILLMLRIFSFFFDLGESLGRDLAAY